MRTAYHATTVDGARAILESGVFRQGCYWAWTVEDALRFAGPVVFEGRFDEDGFKGEYQDEQDAWQFWLREDVPVSDVLASRHWTDDPKLDLATRSCT